MKRELEQILYDKYPLLFREQTLPMSRTCMCWGCEFGDGWFDVIDQLCDKLKDIDGLFFTQVKQKYGTLCIYYFLTNDTPDIRKTVNDIISTFVDMSEKTCEICGKSGILRNNRWVSVLCDECQKEKRKTKV